METIFEAARVLLSAGETGVLAVILGSSGSTPRGEGAKMLVCGDGTLHGTIGGGPMEFAATKAAMEMSGNGARIMDFDMQGRGVTVEPVCGGSASVCLYPLTGKDAPVLEKICLCAQKREGAVFGLWHENGAFRLFCLAGGELTGSGMAEDECTRCAVACEGTAVHDDERLVYCETLAVAPRVLLMGGGHVALATARVAAIAGFEVTVMDDRAEFANPERFPGARCIVCERYDELPVEEITPDDYIVVVTRGHKNDREALEWALKTNACYIGMIGSRTKRDMIYAALREQGISQERIDFVHSPIGLPLGGRSPGEIAVSITAELISERVRLGRNKENQHA